MPLICFLVRGNGNAAAARENVRGFVVHRLSERHLRTGYSANFCTLFKAEARVGGSTTCPNAARLLRIR
jgi:hypothetical protein